MSDQTTATFDLTPPSEAQLQDLAAGLSDEALSHAHTTAMAPAGAAKLEKVLRRYLAALAAQG